MAIASVLRRIGTGLRVLVPSSSAATASATASSATASSATASSGSSATASPRSATASPLLRDILRRLTYQPPQKRAISYVKTKSGIWILEDGLCKKTTFQNMKEKMSQGWEFVGDRVRGHILDNLVRSTFLGIWGAGVFAVTKSLEKLGVTDTEVSNVKDQKEYISAIVKLESEKTLEVISQKHIFDRALLYRMAKDFDSIKKDLEAREVDKETKGPEGHQADKERKGLEAPKEKIATRESSNT